MESISQNDINFLLVLNASEESILSELALEFRRWNCDTDVILQRLKELIKDETIGISRREGSTFGDLPMSEAIEAIKTWNFVQESSLMMFLTEAGKTRWKTYDWGISTKRAKYLMFTIGPVGPERFTENT